MVTFEPAPPDIPQPPPRTLLASLRCLCPSMILAGAIVGSEELIATPKVGAEAGFWLLWLIILGCTLKVFVQIGFGRHTITWGPDRAGRAQHTPRPTLESQLAIVVLVRRRAAYHLVWANRTKPRRRGHDPHVPGE